jgi:hypothetical protein
MEMRKNKLIKKNFHLINEENENFNENNDIINNNLNKE